VGFVSAPLAAAGCASARISAQLRQPGSAASAERLLDLDSNQACFRMENGHAAYLFDLPLPGATRGAQYALYLRLSESPGRHTIGTPLVTGGFEAGVLRRSEGGGGGVTRWRFG